MSSVCSRRPFEYHSYALMRHSYVTHVYLYVNFLPPVCTRMLLVSVRMSFVGYSYVLVCLICISPVYTSMSFVCHLYVLLCQFLSHWYVLVSHSYVTLMYSYVIRSSFLCTCKSVLSAFTMNQKNLMHQHYKSLYSK